MPDTSLTVTDPNGTTLILTASDAADLTVQIAPPGTIDWPKATFTAGQAWALYRFFDRMKLTIVAAIQGGAA